MQRLKANAIAFVIHFSKQILTEGYFFVNYFVSSADHGMEMLDYERQLPKITPIFIFPD
jgi:hypothetical protein